MLRISRSVSEGDQGSSLVTADQILTLIDQNRGRIRTICNMIVSVCGMLLSTSLLLVLFVLRDARPIARSVAPLFLSAIACLGGSLLFSLRAGFPPVPEATASKLALVDILVTTFRAEYAGRKSRWCFCLWQSHSWRWG